MGIVNVTPDSFSDGGRYAEHGTAIAHVKRLIAEGADILDIGGESTRPGAAPIDAATEWARIQPVIAAAVEAGAVVSVDTRRAEVMRQALAAGARIINDVTALTYDADSLAVAASSGASVVLMHMQGEPGTMQQNPHYDDAPAEVEAYLRARVDACRQAGIPDDRIAVDPGIGFGKTFTHNLQILGQLARLRAIGVAVAIGVSRKGFIGGLSRKEPADERLPGSLAAALASVARGAHIVRVHDVAETVQALTIWRAIEAQRPV